MEIIINNLSKRYAKKEVLRNISLTIPEGMYGLLGRNGAGKTSFMRILATLSIPTNGDIQMNGVSIKETTKVREMIGYLPQDFSIYKNMTVFGALDYLGLLSNLPNKIRKERIYTLLEQVHLKDNAKTKVKALSGGMKRRLGIAQALLHNPQILIVDEPTAGLDPEERIHFRNLLSDFSDGRIVILSTHIASDIESTCQNVAVLNKGNILFHGSTETLRKQADHKVYLITVPKSLDKPIQGHHYVLSRNNTNTSIQYRILSNTLPNELAEVQTPTLEDGYMYLLQQAEGEF